MLEAGGLEPSKSHKFAKKTKNKLFFPLAELKLEIV